MARTKSKTELFGKHPLAKSIEPVIEKWSQENYPPINGKQITHITRELMDYWFSDMAHEGEFFHPCQKRAIETIIYCYEILGIPHVEALFEQFSCELLEKDNLRHGIESMEHPRFAVKMATGTGKTWVITALIIWQYWNWVKLNDKRFASHFLLVAPGNIVYERLLDSFLGKKRNGKRLPMTADLKKSLFMPDNLITNWHQLMDTSRQKEITLAEDIGIESRDATVSQRVERFMDFLTYNGDLMVINDEAHHVHNASDAEQVIGRGIRQMFHEPEYRAEKIENYQKIKNKEPLINSYDLLFVVEHPKYNEIYTQLTEAGAAIASGNSIDLSLDTKSVLISIDENRIKALDISWPVSFAYKTEEEIDFSYFSVTELPFFEKPFEEIMQTGIKLP